MKKNISPHSPLPTPHSPLSTVMCKRWFCGLGIAIFNTIFFGANCARAQITPDRTLPNNSIVT
ncbi:MAG: hypothetical protein DSM106950_45695, partial [Stigonema ocellatum SAG 48.90 = DSM 106950]|nr:hypothetical protein [Stigonema ocellatum SAG 48.90 = DSM 106950]